MKRYKVIRLCHQGLGKCGKCIGKDEKLIVTQLETDDAEKANLCWKNWRDYDPEIIDAKGPK